MEIKISLDELSNKRSALKLDDRLGRSPLLSRIFLYALKIKSEEGRNVFSVKEVQEVIDCKLNKDVVRRHFETLVDYKFFLLAGKNSRSFLYRIKPNAFTPTRYEELVEIATCTVLGKQMKKVTGK